MEQFLVRASDDNNWGSVAGQDGRKLNERWLLRLSEAAPNFDVRHVVVGPGAEAREHNHKWEQANFVLEGMGEVDLDGKTMQIATGDFIFVPANATHTFRNISSEMPLALLVIQGRKDNE